MSVSQPIDAATIRELLVIAERAQGRPFSPEYAQYQRKFTPDCCAAIARYALELSDKVEQLESEKTTTPETIEQRLARFNGKPDHGDHCQCAECSTATGRRFREHNQKEQLAAQLQSQAAELERLRDILDKRRRYQ